MAWETAIILAVLGQAGLLILLNMSFEKKRQGVKAFLILLAIGSFVLEAGFLKVITAAQTTLDAGILSSLDKLTTVNLIMTISIFALFVMYFVITYLVATTRAVKEVRQEKEELAWNAV